MKKCVVLFSGGLDSILAVKIMKEQGFDVNVVFLKLPFLKEDIEFIKDFCKKDNVKLKIIDCSKGKYLQEYLNILKNPKYGRGVGFNPCIDCKIFIFRKVRKFIYSKKINLIVSGEVLDERPFSQNNRAFNLIDNETGLKECILRPLSAKLLKETKAEKKEIIDRNKLYDIHGKKRDRQIKLAKKFNITLYPQPSGGCLLCERGFKKRFNLLIKNNLINEKTLKLVRIGRHFFKENCWFVIGRNENENKVIEKFKSSIKSAKKKPAVYYSLSKFKDIAKELQEDYKKDGIKKYSKERL